MDNTIHAPLSCHQDLHIPESREVVEYNSPGINNTAAGFQVDWMAAKEQHHRPAQQALHHVPWQVLAAWPVTCIPEVES